MANKTVSKIEKMSGPLPDDLKKFLVNNARNGYGWRGKFVKIDNTIYIVTRVWQAKMLLKMNIIRTQIPLFECSNIASIYYDIASKSYMLRNGTKTHELASTFAELETVVKRPDPDDVEYIETWLGRGLPQEFVKVFKSKEYQALVSLGEFEVKDEDGYGTSYYIADAETVAHYTKSDDDEMYTHGEIVFGVIQHDDALLYHQNSVYVFDIKGEKEFNGTFEEYVKSLYKKYNEENGTIQEGFFGKLWDKAKENAEKKFPGAKPQPKTQSSPPKQSIPDDFPIDKTVFKKIIDEIKAETETDVVILTGFDQLKNPKPDDSCAYGKPVYAPMIPKTSEGDEMRFIIQINLSDVPHVIPDLPTSGILQLWLGPLKRKGQESKVLYYPNTSKPSIADQVSDKVYTPDYLEDPWFEGSPILRRVGFKTMKDTLMPQTDNVIDNYEEIFANKWNDNDSDKTHTSEDVWRLISKYPNAFPRWEYPCGADKIGGYPEFIQHDTRDSRYNKNNSVMLLQLTSDDYIGWGDNGNAYLFITKESLKKKDFSKADFDSQCY